MSCALPPLKSHDKSNLSLPFWHWFEALPVIFQIRLGNRVVCRKAASWLGTQVQKWSGDLSTPRPGTSPRHQLIALCWRPWLSKDESGQGDQRRTGIDGVWWEVGHGYEKGLVKKQQ